MGVHSLMSNARPSVYQARSDASRVFRPLANRGSRLLLSDGTRGEGQDGFDIGVTLLSTPANCLPSPSRYSRLVILVGTRPTSSCKRAHPKILVEASAESGGEGVSP